jgi:hypothetical protein
MPSKMTDYGRFVLFVSCPKCKRGNGRRCRNEKGECVPVHRERARLALQNSCATLTALLPRRSA